MSESDKGHMFKELFVHESHKIVTEGERDIVVQEYIVHEVTFDSVSVFFFKKKKFNAVRV
jgi:hypothetical protein